MASAPVAAATAALIGLLFAGTIGLDGVVTVWAALSLADVPAAVVWGSVALTGLGFSVLTVRIALAAWRVERTVEATAAET